MDVSPFWWMEISSGQGGFLQLGRRLFVGGSVQGLSWITPERTVRFGRDKHQKMRQSAGTTMAFVTWRHVPRGTCHVPPREPLAKPYRKDQIFERKVTETRNFQGRCTPGGYTCHVSDDPIGSKLCPQGTISFFSFMPSSSETLRPIDTKLMPFDAVSQGLSTLKNLWGSEN